MSNFSFDDLLRRDFLRGLGLWIVIEIVSFLVLPGLGAIQPGDRLKFWFGLSIPLGIGGALLLGGSSRFVALTNERMASGNKTLLTLLGQFGGSIGIAGILFPFVMAAGEFLAKIFDR
ncbi:MAG: hypothetical protein KME45_18170 [Stenomitos rutilans HA7619-LM2]|jgi:hypothetical protein|nr:hypothetical protein [Stenomitos rutilans HA7619-LM2]